MSRRFLPFAATVVLTLGCMVPALAEPVTPEPLKPVEPPTTLPRAQRGDRTQNLDRLFEALKVAPDDDSAKYVENRIWAIWLGSPSDTANLLMGRVKTAVDGKDLDLAIKLLDAVIDIRPDFVEAWNERSDGSMVGEGGGRSRTLRLGGWSHRAGQVSGLCGGAQIGAELAFLCQVGNLYYFVRVATSE